MEMRLFFACLVSICLSCTAAKTSTEYPADSFVIEGTMEFLNIETGCWLVVTKSGTRYEPAGEDLSILWHDGLPVTLRVRQMKEVASVCQAGTVVEVFQILKTGEI